MTASADMSGAPVVRGHGARAHMPLWAGLVLYAALVLGVALASIGRNDGRLVYAVDDTYIHMAMARNLAEHGVWGVTQYEFTSSSSSPLWTLMLALAYRLFGVSDTAPFALNVLLGAATLAAVHWLTARLGAPPAQRFVAVVGAMAFAPIAFLVFVAMEHLLHALISILLVGVISLEVGGDRHARREPPAWVLAALLMATRYESAFLIAACLGVLILARRHARAVAMLVASCVPVLAYGVVSMAHGWMFLPSSVALKGMGRRAPLTQGIHGLTLAVRDHTQDLPHLTVLVIAATVIWAVLALRRRSALGPGQVAAMLFVTATLLHLAFMFGGGTAMDLRYTGYLVLLGAAVVGGVPWSETLGAAFSAVAARLRLSKASRLVIGTAAAAAMGVPVLLAMTPVLGMAAGGTVRGTENIYRQQYQMAKLARLLPAGTALALNDIGAVCYYADIRCVDLVGLATRDIARAQLHLKRAQRTRMRDVYATVTANARVQAAVLYDPGFHANGADGHPGCPFPPSHPHVPNMLPQQWVPLGVWWTPRNATCAYDVVTFYATTPRDADLVKNALSEATRTLPRDMVARLFGARVTEP